jgi:very-short-patch-repair endonuclease
MLWILASIVVISVVLALLAALGNKKEAGEQWPVFPKRLLSENEQNVFRKLARAMPEHLVFAQVAVSQLVGVRKGANFTAVFNRYSRLVADFVVCRRDFSVLAVVELDDRQHDHPRRQEADRRKTEVLGAAGIRVIRLNGAALPGEDELVRQIAEPGLL